MDRWAGEHAMPWNSRAWGLPFPSSPTLSLPPPPPHPQHRRPMHASQVKPQYTLSPVASISLVSPPLGLGAPRFTPPPPIQDKIGIPVQYQHILYQYDGPRSPSWAQSTSEGRGDHSRVHMQQSQRQHHRATLPPMKTNCPPTHH
jgi:hypothetical protein